MARVEAIIVAMADATRGALLFARRNHDLITDTTATNAHDGQTSSTSARATTTADIAIAAVIVLIVVVVTVVADHHGFIGSKQSGRRYAHKPILALGEDHVGGRAVGEVDRLSRRNSIYGKGNDDDDDHDDDDDEKEEEESDEDDDDDDDEDSGVNRLYSNFDVMHGMMYVS